MQQYKLQASRGGLLLLKLIRSKHACCRWAQLCCVAVTKHVSCYTSGFHCARMLSLAHVACLSFALLLQVCPYDCRHTLATINSHAAHVLAAAAGQQQPCQQLDLFVYESDPENLARHMLLLAVLVDASFTARERAEMFLELHGNILLRQRTADWVCE